MLKISTFRQIQWDPTIISARWCMYESVNSVTMVLIMICSPMYIVNIPLSLHDDVINGNIFRVTGPLCGEFTDHRWIVSQSPVARLFDIFFDSREAGDLKRHRAHYNVSVMTICYVAMFRRADITLYIGTPIKVAANVFKNKHRDHTGYGLSQWEGALHNNASSHWPSPYRERSLWQQQMKCVGNFQLWLGHDIIGRTKASSCRLHCTMNAPHTVYGYWLGAMHASDKETHCALLALVREIAGHR